jgi:hypothetical protein
MTKVRDSEEDVRGRTDQQLLRTDGSPKIRD